MKKFYFLTGVLLSGAFMLGANPFLPGGIETDWMKYDPKPAEQVSAVNILKNGSFEMEGTELSGWRGKGHWSGWGHVHSGKKTPEMKALKAKFSKTAFRSYNFAMHINRFHQNS